MKVAVITDQHIGFKKGSKLYHDYFLKFYDEVFFPTLQERNITTVLDLGDTFDNRKGIDLYSLDWAKQNYFDRLQALGISVISIVGNHTAFYKNTNHLNTINLLLREYDNITTLRETTELEIGGCKILFVPWINPENKEETYSKIEQTTAKMCMGHLELNGFTATHGHVMENGDDVVKYNKFTKVFSGHYHTRSSNGKIFYLGNPYEMFWNDVNDSRGFHLFDTETLETETINNPFQLYKIIVYDNTPRQLFKFNEYKDKIVKLVVKEKDNEKEYERFLEALINANPYDLKVIEKIQGVNFNSGLVEHTEDTVTLLDSYVDDMETDLEKSRIKSIVSELYREACEVG